MKDIRELLIQQAQTLGWKVTPRQAEQFQLYMELLLEWNEKMNLTSITEPEQVVEKHFLDSMTLLAWGKQVWNCHYEILVSGMNRTGAHKFYQALGFEEVKGFKKYL